MDWETAGAGAAHQPSDFSNVGVHGRHVADNATPINDQQAVAERYEFVEVGGDYEDGAALVAHGDEQPVDQLNGANVDALARLIRDDEPRVAREFAGELHLLLVAA